MDSTGQPESQPSLVDTQPVKSTLPLKNRRWRWFLFSISAILFAGLIILLTLPTLSSPPSEIESPYELFSLAQVSEPLDPGVDHLVSALDGVVELYIPAGIDIGTGNLVILPRLQQFIPKLVEPESFRQAAVDIFLVRPNGDLVNSIEFEPAMLLCYSLTVQEQADRSLGVARFAVHRYDEHPGGAQWISLDPAPGWRENQVCAPLKHLSLYALGIKPALTDLGSPFPKIIEASSTPTATPLPSLDGLELYGFPSGTAAP